MQLAARPGSPESLQQLVEIAKNTTSSSGQAGLGISKDDKGRLLKDKKVSWAPALLICHPDTPFSKSTSL